MFLKIIVSVLGDSALFQFSNSQSVLSAPAPRHSQLYQLSWEFHHCTLGGYIEQCK